MGHLVAVLVVRLSMMRMQVYVVVGSMLMNVQVPLLSQQRSYERDPENDEHHAHAEFKSLGEPGRDPDLKQQEECREKEEDNGMSDPPT